MLKETITYTDFDGDTQEETLYFNITKTDMTDLMDLLPELEAWQERTAGSDENMSPEDKVELMRIVKILIRHSYGIREDARHFRKSEAIREDFESSAAYDAFVFSMFENPEKCVNFMIGILPKELLEDEEVLAAAKTAQDAARSVETVEIPANVQDLKAVDQEVPAWIREDREPTKAEQANMSREELLLAFQRKNAN